MRTKEECMKFKGLLVLPIAVGLLAALGKSPEPTSAVRWEKQDSTQCEITDVVATSNSWGAVTVEGTIKNPSEDKKQYVTISVPVYDLEGNRLHDAWTSVSNLKGAEEREFKAVVTSTADLSELDIKLDDMEVCYE